MQQWSGECAPGNILTIHSMRVRKPFQIEKLNFAVSKSKIDYQCNIVTVRLDQNGTADHSPPHTQNFVHNNHLTTVKTIEKQLKTIKQSTVDEICFSSDTLG